MKNKNYSIISMIILCLLILTADAGLCGNETVEQLTRTVIPAAGKVLGSNVMPLKVVLIKFGIAMGLVLCSLVVIIFGINLYRKFSKPPSRVIPRELYNDTLKTPGTIDEAIISFIKKNKL